MIVPERDFLAQAERQRNLVMIVSGLALIVAVLLAGVLARHYSRLLEELARQSTRVQELRLDETAAVQSPLREVAELSRANAQTVTTLKSFSRYVPTDLVRRLLQRGEVARIGGREAELTILFTDISGFTSVSERMAPQDLTNHMAEYFSAMLEELNREHATVDSNRLPIRCFDLHHRILSPAGAGVNSRTEIILRPAASSRRPSALHCIRKG